MVKSKIIIGNAVEELKKMESGSVNCIITSPPYWSLRKYDIPDLIWDGVEGCEHEWGEEIPKGGRIKRTQDFDPKYAMGIASEEGNPFSDKTSNFCLHCSAWRGQLGLEPTIDLYLKHLLSVFDECKRVLKDDGTMFVNLGDSYNSHSTGQGNVGGIEGKRKNKQDNRANVNKDFGILPDKCLALIPEQFAIAMVNRGWILRNKIIWKKPNCMPSSVKDRFTVDFEPVFFFVKSRKYWFEQQYDANMDTYNGQRGNNLTRQKMQSAMRTKSDKDYYGLGRNRRCVWTIPTQPYPESHFSTFPEALVEPMIRAGCPKEICVKCGKAREKIYKLGEVVSTGGGYVLHKGNPNKLTKGESKTTMRQREHIESGYTDCGCNADFSGGIVLDPFCGSGTVLKVAKKLGRQAIGIDLGYAELSSKRLNNLQYEWDL